MNSLQTVKSYLQPGMVYRRADVSKWSNAVDRHLKQLQKERYLVKLASGLYFCPKETVFGYPPPSDQVLVTTFLKDTRFLLTTPNSYNSLGVGTTQFKLSLSIFILIYSRPFLFVSYLFPYFIEENELL